MEIQQKNQRRKRPLGALEELLTKNPKLQKPFFIMLLTSIIISLLIIKFFGK
jgi:hypothetical protein